MNITLEVCSAIRIAVAAVLFTPNVVHAESALFGLAGITTAETARLNVVVTSGTSAGCRVAMAFIHSDGRVLKQDVKAVLPGRATYLEITGIEAALPPGPIAVRTAIRPIVEIAPVQTGDVCRMLASFELVDNATGRTAIFAHPTPAL